MVPDRPQFTIKKLGKKRVEKQSFYENQLVKSKIPSKLIQRVVENKTENGRKMSKLKLKGIEEPEWVNKNAYSL